MIKNKLIITLISILMISSLLSCSPNNDAPIVISGDEFDSGNIEEIIPTQEEVPIINNELFSDYYDKAEQILNEMTLEEKVGQMFLAAYPESISKAKEEIKTLYPGGYILFARETKNDNPESLKKKIEDTQIESNIKMLIAVDEEGGTVTRVSTYKAYRNSKFEAPLKIYQNNGMDSIISDSHEKSILLEELGINMNLAPVVDIPTSKNSFMYARSMGTDSELTSEFASKIVTKMNEDNMISCLKHFPGYGDNVDTHTGIATDERSYDEFINNDFKPFIAGIEAQGPAIMINHNVVNCMDEKYPASLSPEVHRVLREELNYTGLIVTDDLAMQAVKAYVDNGEAAVQAVLAGNDMIITSSLSKHVNEVLNAVKDEIIDMKTVDMAVKRILACKLRYNIISEWK